MIEKILSVCESGNSKNFISVIYNEETLIVSKVVWYNNNHNHDCVITRSLSLDNNEDFSVVDEHTKELVPNEDITLSIDENGDVVFDNILNYLRGQ